MRSIVLAEYISDRASPETTTAEACLQQALDIARQQRAKALELRAAALGPRWCGALERKATRLNQTARHLERSKGGVKPRFP